MNGLKVKNVVGSCFKVIPRQNYVGVCKNWLCFNYFVNCPLNLRNTSEFISSENLSRTYFTSQANFKIRERSDRKSILATVGNKDEGNEGEYGSYVDTAIRGFGDIFPDETTPNMLVGDARFSDLPVVHVKVSKNNTILSLQDSKGICQLVRSCGFDGFKNAKKGTNIAAQVTAQNFGMQILNKGYKDVRVAIRGLGPGRMSSMKGLTLGGLNVISISDVTPLSFDFKPRPRKAKRH